MCLCGRGALFGGQYARDSGCAVMLSALASIGLGCGFGLTAFLSGYGFGVRVGIVINVRMIPFITTRVVG